VGVPLLPADHGAMLELALAAVGGFREIDGTRPPDVSSTASCFRWSLKLIWGVESFRGRSLGGGAGGTVPGEISDSFSMLLHGVSMSQREGGGRGRSRLGHWRHYKHTQTAGRDTITALSFDCGAAFDVCDLTNSAQPYQSTWSRHTAPRSRCDGSIRTG
jgi:hypothetical protein